MKKQETKKSFCYEVNGYKAVRRRPKCQLTDELIADGSNVVAFQNSKLRNQDKIQYCLRSAWYAFHNADEAANVLFGTPAKHECQFQFIIDGEIADHTMVDVITPNGAQPKWYRTTTGVCSPRYCQAEWHKRIATIEEGMQTGTVVIRLWHRGKFIGARKIDWSKRNELGQYKKALANTHSTMKLIQMFKNEAMK